LPPLPSANDVCITALLTLPSFLASMAIVIAPLNSNEPAQATRPHSAKNSPVHSASDSLHKRSNLNVEK